MTRHGAAGLALGITFFIVASCGTALGGDWNFEIRAADAPARLAADAADDGPLLNLIARTITDELKLRLPAVVPYAAYGSEQAFVAALIAQGRSADRAQQLGRSSLAVTLGRDRILARGDSLSSKSIAERAAVYGHELAHVAQARFGDHDKHVPMWMWEGHAEWVGYRVAGLLDLKPYAEARRETRRSVGATTQRAALPPLSLLDTREGWRSARERGTTVTAIYGQSFLAIDWLVERYGEESLRDYLRSYSRSQPLTAADDAVPRNWRLAFPIAYDDFVLEFRRYLSSTTHP
jgi:hypothetical protein